MTANSQPVIGFSRRSMAAGLWTGVCLLSAVVFTRRALGAGSNLASESIACGVAAVVMLAGVWSASCFLPQTQDRHTRWLCCGLASMPGLLLGLAIAPAESASSLAAIIALSTLTTVTGSLTSGCIEPLTRSTGIPAALSSRDASLSDAHQKGVVSESGSRTQQIASTTSLAIQAATQNRDLEVHSTGRAVNPAMSHLLTDSGLSDEEGDGDEEIESDIDPDLEATEALHPSLDPHVRQWLTRGELDGHETCEGGVKLRFAPRTKLVAVHVPFAPPFASIPEFNVEPLDDAEVEVRVTGVHAYGVRFEVTRRTHLDRELIAEVGYSASAVAHSNSESSSSELPRDARLRSA